MRQSLLMSVVAGFVLHCLSSCSSCERNDVRSDKDMNVNTDTNATYNGTEEQPHTTGARPTTTHTGPADNGYTGPEELSQPIVYFAGGSRDDTSITIRELQTAGGIRVAVPGKSTKRFTVSKWSFNAFYNGELVGHVGTNQHLTEDMKILIAEQKPGNVVIIDDVVAKDEKGRMYELDDLQLRIE